MVGNGSGKARDGQDMKKLAALALLVVALVSGCSSSAPPAELTAEQRFEDAVLSYPGFTPSSNPGANAKLVENGRGVCAVMDTPGTTEQSMIRSMMLVGYTEISAAIITGMAVQNLCPGKTWPATERPAAEAAPTPAPVPVQTGPRTSFADGTWEVGVDVAAGKVKTAGASTCYWARLTGSGGDIIDNNVGAGPQTVVIKAGEYFESQTCGTWTKAG